MLYCAKFHAFSFRRSVERNYQQVPTYPTYARIQTSEKEKRSWLITCNDVYVMPSLRKVGLLDQTVVFDFILCAGLTHGNVSVGLD